MISNHIKNYEKEFHTSREHYKKHLLKSSKVEEDTMQKTRKWCLDIVILTSESWNDWKRFLNGKFGLRLNNIIDKQYHERSHSKSYLIHRITKIGLLRVCATNADYNGFDTGIHFIESNDSCINHYYVCQVY